MALYDVDWAGLKRYISDKENYERDFGAAAPLTDAEKAAVSALIPPPQATLGAAASDVNWISTLMHYLQVRHHTSDMKFADEPVQSSRSTGKGTDLKWRCFIDLPDGEGSFPRDGYGVAVGEPKPAFARKQDAKQHAARSACEYLMETHRMSISSLIKTAGPSKQSSSVATPLPGTASPPPETDTTLPSQQSSQDQQAPQKDTTSYNAIPGLSIAAFSSDDIAAQPPQLLANKKSSSSNAVPTDNLLPIASKVMELAKSLKLPSPRYECYPDPGNGSTWSVTADFNNHLLPPAGLGSFSGVLTKKGARERSAEAVLEWMVSVKEHRDQVAREFLGQ